jgi:hypothetical protein
MELSEAVEIVVARTGHERYRELVRGRPDYAALVIALAEGRDLTAAGPMPPNADSYPDGMTAIRARRAAKPRGPLGTKLYSQPGVG